MSYQGEGPECVTAVILIQPPPFSVSSDANKSQAIGALFHEMFNNGNGFTN